jgi:hypothetical protein
LAHPPNLMAFGEDCSGSCAPVDRSAILKLSRDSGRNL